MIQSPTQHIHPLIIRLGKRGIGSFLVTSAEKFLIETAREEFADTPAADIFMEMGVRASVCNFYVCLCDGYGCAHMCMCEQPRCFIFLLSLIILTGIIPVMHVLCYIMTIMMNVACIPV
jgi:hypothetical protein